MFKTLLIYEVPVLSDQIKEKIQNFKWNFFLILIIIFLIVPLVSLCYFALNYQSTDIFSLNRDLLFSYLSETFFLIIGVIFLSGFLGISLAWFVTFFEFPLSRFFQWSLFMPIAIPTYVQAFIFIDLFSYTGLVRRSINGFFSISIENQNWLPNIENIYGAIIVFSLVLYPYIYILVRTNFCQQSNINCIVSQSLGRSTYYTFFNVSLPLARDAIIIGLTLVCMEALQDFTTVDLFSVKTLSVAIYDLWTNYTLPDESARLGMLMVSFILIILFFETQLKRKFYLNQNDSHAKLKKFKISKTKQYFLTLFCGFVLLIAFIMPVLSLIWKSYLFFDNFSFKILFQSILNSLKVSFPSMFFILFIGAILAFGNKFKRFSKNQLILKILNFGYIMPGILLAIGILLTVTTLSRLIDWFFIYFFNLQTNVVLNNSILIIVYAYIIRFFVFGINGIHSSLDKLSDNYEVISKLYGMNNFQTAKKIHLPLIKGSILTTSLLVFVECIKELPATLLLRPPNFETLSTQIYQYASNEDFYQASLPALIIVILSLISVLLFHRAFLKVRS